jgi:MinD-like ATPase involved in chromosome partitioning or flagellar assembly
LTPDHTDLTPENIDLGVLSDAANPDTAVLGILGGATAQVSVSLPLADEDDLLDDDVVGDEVDFAAEGGHVVADVPASASDERDESVHAAIADGDDEAEDAVDGEAVDPADEAVDAAGEHAVAADRGEDEAPIEDEAVIEAEVVEEIEGGTGAKAPRPTSTAGGGASATDIVDVEPVEAPAPTTPADDEQAGAVDGDGPAGKEASMDETRAEHVRDVERVRRHKPELTLTSKRIDEFEAGKETSDLLTADRLLEPGTKGRGEPEGGWQHLVYSLSGGRIVLGDGKRARARKELTGRIAAPLTGGARFVPVLSRKGGVGKTTITTLLGMALADARDDRIIAIDANPDRGTLAERIARPSGKTVRDLVRMKGEIDGYNSVSTIVARDQTRLDVLASDADPHVSEAFSDSDYEDVAALAAHYYSIVLTDTGTGIVHSVMGATLGLADQLVIVSGLSIDEARLASETLTWLESNGYAAQVRGAVVVLNNARPGAPLVRESELEAHFSTRVRAVVRMPYDPLIATGSAIAFRELQPATRQAARELAATVVEGLRGLAVAA